MVHMAFYILKSELLDIKYT